MAATPPHPPTRRADDELSLRELLHLVHRRRWLLLLCMFLGGLAGIVVLAFVPPVYVASTLLLIEPDRRGRNDTTVASASDTLDSAAVDSQVQILASRSLAREAIDALSLTAGTVPPGQTGILTRLLPPSVAAPLESTHAPPPDPVADFLSRLTVKRDGKSHVIAVAFRSPDPVRAAEVANKLAELYMAAQRSRKQAAARRQSGWLDERLALLERELGEAERRLAAFRSGAGTPPSNGRDGRGGELASLGGQLVAASIERSAKEAALQRMQRVAAGGGEELDSVAQFGGSPLMANLSALKAETLRREAELTAQYGERHPKILAVRAEKDKLEARLRQERRAMLRQFEAEVDQARAKEGTLARKLAELKGEAAQSEQVSQRVEELEHEVELKRRLYEAQLARIDAEDRPAEAVGPDARVLSEAVPPGNPSFPDARLVLSLSLTSGFLLGLAALYLAEAGDPGLRAPREVEAVLGLPTLALVPKIEAGRGEGTAPQDYAVERPRSRYAEALRTLLAGLLRPQGGGDPAQAAADRPRVVLVTSSLPREGKSTLVASLARVAAGEGLRVIVVDADLRKPSLHALLGFKPSAGLVEVLRREVTLADAVVKDTKAPMRLLPGSPRLTQPTRLLGPDGLGTLLRALKRSFDLVLVDSAPLAAVADPKLLAGLVDAVLYVVRYGDTRREFCRSCLDGLRENGANVAGVVLTQVDPRDQKRRYGHEAGPAGERLVDYYAD